jgi:hypothetical protein
MFELFFFITFGLSDENAYSVLVLSNKIISDRKCRRYFIVDRTPTSTLGVHIKMSTNYDMKKENQLDATQWFY